MIPTHDIEQTIYARDNGITCIKCGNSMQVWVNQRTGKWTCHRVGCADNGGLELTDTFSYHTDGSAWTPCAAAFPKKDKTAIVDGIVCHVYHPDAKDLDDDPTGQDDHYECPHCGADWWIEHD